MVLNLAHHFLLQNSKKEIKLPKTNANKIQKHHQCVHGSHWHRQLYTQWFALNHCHQWVNTAYVCWYPFEWRFFVFIRKHVIFGIRNIWISIGWFFTTYWKVNSYAGMESGSVDCGAHWANATINVQMKTKVIIFFIKRKIVQFKLISNDSTVCNDIQIRTNSQLGG